MRYPHDFPKNKDETEALRTGWHRDQFVHNQARFIGFSLKSQPLLPERVESLITWGQWESRWLSPAPGWGVKYNLEHVFAEPHV